MQEQIIISQDIGVSLALDVSSIILAIEGTLGRRSAVATRLKRIEFPLLEIFIFGRIVRKAVDCHVKSICVRPGASESF